jgi:hypothetical protein
LLLVLLQGCAEPSSDAVLQTAIQGGMTACEVALANPKTKWGPGAREYCQRMANGCEP